MPLTKLRILTHRMTRAERRFSLRTLVALSSLPLFGVVAAFGLAPDTNTLDITPETITEAIALPVLASANANTGTFERESVIQSGDTLSSALSRLNIDDLEIQRLLATDAVRQLASSIRVGKRIQATTTQDGQLLTIQFERSDAPALTVRRQGDSLCRSRKQRTARNPRGHALRPHFVVAVWRNRQRRHPRQDCQPDGRDLLHQPGLP